MRMFFAIFAVLTCLSLLSSCYKSCTEGPEEEVDQVKAVEPKIPEPRQEDFTGDILLPEGGLLHCGNDPGKKGGVPVPGRKGLYECPSEMDLPPVCAYYTKSPADDERMLIVQQYKNQCRLCAQYFKKNETWVLGDVTYHLVGYEEGPCSQGAYRPNP